MEHGGYALAGEAHDGPFELPPGFRFHPTDEELITHYLSRKVADGGFVSRVIGDVDLNKIEPWDLPWRAKMGEKEWYFFAVRDRKYPTGLRTNRATDAGYWKATGKDKEIHRGRNVVGMKKTLVFYRGRAPKGEKTDWVMHEYRLDGNLSLYNLPKTAKNEWVICRVFQKSPSAAGNGGGVGDGGKRVAGLVRLRSSSCGDEMMLAGISGDSFLMPPSVDHSQFAGATAGKVVRASPAAPGAAHVTCFSNPMEGAHMGHFAGDPLFSASTANPSPEVSSWAPPLLSGKPYPDGCLMGSLRVSGAGLVQLLQGHGYGVEEGCKPEDVGGSLSQETGLTSDVNPEISSPALCKGEAHNLRFDVRAREVPPSPAPRTPGNFNPPMDDCVWNY